MRHPIAAQLAAPETKEFCQRLFLASTRITAQRSFSGSGRDGLFF